MMAERGGGIHLWVEVQLQNGDTAIADIFTMQSDPNLERGETIAVTEYPDAYKTFPQYIIQI